MNLAQRIPIRCLVISKYKQVDKNKRPTQYDIAIITPDSKYVEYEISIRHEYLAPCVMEKLRSLFVEYRFDSNTHVCFIGDIAETEPIYMYIQCLSLYIGFSTRCTTLEKVLTRIGGQRWWLFHDTEHRPTNMKYGIYDL